MQSDISKLTSKYQATIPARVRQALQLKAGDSIVFDVENEAVQLRKAQQMDIEFSKALSATLNEWSSAADEEAYRDL